MFLRRYGCLRNTSVIFGMCKAAVDRMARDMAIEFQPHNVASISLWQGLTLTERAQNNLARNPENEEGDGDRPCDCLFVRVPGPGDRRTGRRCGF